jgi:hypothetical protein
LALALALCLSFAAHAQDTSKRGRKYKAPPPTAKFEVTVVRASTGKPVENAAVVFHPLVDGRDNGNMELKTNQDGKAMIDLLAIGSSVRVQVIADGFQTYGEDYKVDKDDIAIQVKLNRPGKQYSIYKKSEGNEPDKNAPDAAPKSTSPATQPDAQPDAQPDPQPNAPKDTPDPKDSSSDSPGSSPKPQTSSQTPPK